MERNGSDRGAGGGRDGRPSAGGWTAVGRTGRALLLASLVVAASVVGTVALSGVGTTDTSTPGGTVGTSYVVLGATDQTPVDADGQRSLSLRESTTDDFAGSGTVRLEIPRSSGLTFDRANSSLEVEASGSEDIEASAPAFDGRRALEFDVDGASDVALETVNVTGVRFRVPPTTEPTELTWTYRDLSATYRVVPEHLQADVATTGVVRGARQQPRAGTRVVVASAVAPQPDGQHDEGTLPDEPDLNASGFHAAGENITVEIPEERRDDLSFDTSYAPAVAVDSTGGARHPTFVDEYTITFRVDERVDAGEEIELEGVRFNTTGVESPSDPAEFATGLEVSAVPVAAIDPPTRVGTVGENVVARAPTSALGDPAARDDSDVTLEAGTARTTGENGTYVAVRDDPDGTAGEVSSAGRVVIRVPEGTGVTFDRSQGLAVQRVGEGSLDGHVESVNASTIVVAVDTASADGDVLAIGRHGGGDDPVAPLRYNVSGTASATDAHLVVRTHGGSATVTRDTSAGRPAGEVRDIDVVASDEQTATPTSTATATTTATATSTEQETHTSTEQGTHTSTEQETHTEDGSARSTPSPSHTTLAPTDSPQSTDQQWTGTATQQTTGTPVPTLTAVGTTDDGGTATARSTDTVGGTVTRSDGDDTRTPVVQTREPDSSNGFGPGFGLLGGVVAVLGAALLALRRQ